MFTLGLNKNWVSSICFPTYHGEDNDYESWTQWKGLGCGYISHIDIYRKGNEIEIERGFIFSFLMFKLTWRL